VKGNRIGDKPSVTVDSAGSLFKLIKEGKVAIVVCRLLSILLFCEAWHFWQELLGKE